MIADSETDPILREQLRDLAHQYDEIAESTMLRRETLNGMRRRFSVVKPERAKNERLTEQSAASLVPSDCARSSDTRPVPPLEDQ